MVEVVVDMDIPGWIEETEILEICKFIELTGMDDILEIGPFAGRLTNSICKAFPEKKFTVVDIFPSYDYGFSELANRTYMTCGPQYMDVRFSEEFFKGLHSHANLVTHRMDIYDYDQQHDMVIISVSDDAEGYEWEKMLDKSLSLSKYHTIGSFTTLCPTRALLYSSYRVTPHMSEDFDDILMFEIKGKI